MRHKLGYSSFSGIGRIPQAEKGKGPTRPPGPRPATDPNTACADRAAALLIGGNEGGDGGRHEWRLRAPVPPRNVVSRGNGGPRHGPPPPPTLGAPRRSRGAPRYSD